MAVTLEGAKLLPARICARVAWCVCVRVRVFVRARSPLLLHEAARETNVDDDDHNDDDHVLGSGERPREVVKIECVLHRICSPQND